MFQKPSNCSKKQNEKTYELKIKKSDGNIIEINVFDWICNPFINFRQSFAII